MKLFDFIKKKKAENNPKAATSKKQTASERLLSKVEKATKRVTDLYGDDSDLGYC